QTFNGNFLKIFNATPSEYWFVKAMEYYIQYEWNQYQTMRPLSISSWPTLDPLSHPEEIFPDEDTASIDLSKVVDDNYPPGIFISYHAYPYYPYFVSYQSDYQPFFDYMGPNSYLGYLTALKTKYQNFPLIIAEFGVPSAWVVAKYSSSGMNHGGEDEWEQGIFNLRMLNNIRSANCGGGIMFAWIDEWFKRTWIADPLDYLPDRRPMWLNEMSPEQNFGLLRFDKDPAPFVPWAQFTNPGQKIYRVSASATYKDFRFVVVPTFPFSEMDTIFIGIDTYDDFRGEFLFPTGHTSNSGNEFMLKITNAGAELFVTPAYDLYGIWHGISPPSSLYHSVLSIGGGWNLVRIKNNEPDYNIQYIGNLKMNYCGHFPSSTDAVIFCADSVIVNLPWNLIHFIDPSQKRVFHDYRSTWQTEDTISTGIRLNILYKNQVLSTPTRYGWDNWIEPGPYKEIQKASYTIVKNGLPQFNTRPLAIYDIFNTPTNTNVVRTTQNGPLANDFDLDGNYLSCAMQTMPSHGTVMLTPDGNMIYTPNPDFVGTDHFRYVVFDGQSWSEPASIFINVGVVGLDENPNHQLHVLPNPTKEYFWVKSSEKIRQFFIWNTDGRLMYSGSGFPEDEEETLYKFDTSHFKPGTYIIQGTSESSFFIRRLVVL
ncbi:MAG: Ig-like domain-containing protein, partial [Flavobacteriales bacterium]|nr:Ig-like domain-containing protein [Flavobacteriales bacterium]MDW8431418.1 Ig-like domain-containing protein [Flavobacteriales bacterium]